MGSNWRPLLGALIVLCAASAAAQPGPTPVVRGPLHVEGNRILDSENQPILLRGTQLRALDLDEDPGPPAGIAGLTATTFSTIRQRWNMNVVRLLVSVRRWEDEPAYLDRIDEIVQKANRAELAVILAPVEDAAGLSVRAGLPTERTVRFWRVWAEHFRDNPEVLFDLLHNPVPAQIPHHQPGVHSRGDWTFWRNGGTTVAGASTVGMQAVDEAIRTTGATQVIVAMGLNQPPFFEGFDDATRLRDDNVIYEICPLHRTTRTDAERDVQFGLLAARVPFLANNWDLRLTEDSPECRALPPTPEQAADLVRASLKYFDEREISWTVSFFEPGKMIRDYATFDPTTLHKVWTCGVTENPPLGMGEEVRFHMWGNAREDVTLVNGAAGSTLIPQGGVAIAYGPDMSEGEAIAPPGDRPTQLAGVSFEITDSAGKAHLAPLLYVSPTQINILVPADTAAGPAIVKILHPTSASPTAETNPAAMSVPARTRTFIQAGGSMGPTGKAFLAPLAPGLFTATANARGPAVGYAVHRDPGGEEWAYLIWQCNETDCQTEPITISPEFTTELILYGTGFGNNPGENPSTAELGPAPQKMQATIGGVPVPILSITPVDGFPAVKELRLGLSEQVRGVGETDLLLTVEGRVANSVRIRVE
jgi:uncharacterized protein (TIGR03437 family)